MATLAGEICRMLECCCEFIYVSYRHTKDLATAPRYLHTYDSKRILLRIFVNPVSRHFHLSRSSRAKSVEESTQAFCNTSIHHLGQHWFFRSQSVQPSRDLDWFESHPQFTGTCGATFNLVDWQVTNITEQWWTIHQDNFVGRVRPNLNWMTIENS
jgi:hypothetical protein